MLAEESVNLFASMLLSGYVRVRKVWTNYDLFYDFSLVVQSPKALRWLELLIRNILECNHLLHHTSEALKRESVVDGCCVRYLFASAIERERDRETKRRGEKERERRNVSL